jgi:DNA-binding NarL/FixJ family response regulator
MLETIREFALERLAEAGAEDAARHRHAEWCLAFAERAGPGAKRPDGAAWREALEREHANLRAGLNWLADQGDGPRLTRLAGRLWSFWQEHAHYAEGRRWLELAIDLGRDAPAAERLRTLTGAGAMAWYQMDIIQAHNWIEQTLPLAREVGNREDEAFALINLASLAVELGDPAQEIANLEAGLALARDVGASEPAILALHNLAYLAWRRGDAAAAKEQLEEALTLARQRDVLWIVPNILIGLGLASADLGNHPRAAALLHEGLELGLARGNLSDVIDALEGVARLGAATGHSVPAARLIGAAATLRDDIATPMSPSEVTHFEPILAALRDVLGGEPFAAALAAGRAVSREDAIAEALTFLSAAPEPAPLAVRGHHAAPHGLTGREVEILRLLAAGESNREIAEQLFISPTTVARHVANIFGKLGVDTRAKASAQARRLGLE